MKNKNLMKIADTSFNDSNKLAKYFVVSYVVVSILDTVGLNVKSSRLLVESLCTFGLP